MRPSGSLEEETGYNAANWEPLIVGCSSAGLTDEAATFFLAKDLTKSVAGGRVDGEAITVHEPRLTDLMLWLGEAGVGGALGSIPSFSPGYTPPPTGSERQRHDAGRDQENQ